MHSFMEDTGINERYFHGLELRLAVLSNRLASRWAGKFPQQRTEMR